MPRPRLSRPRLSVSGFMPSDRFWTSHNVGFKLKTGVFDAADDMVILTGPADDASSRVLADAVAHLTGGRMIDAEPFPAGRGTGIVNIIAEDAGDVPPGNLVIAAFVCADPKTAIAVAEKMLSSARIRDELNRSIENSTFKTAPGVLIMNEADRLGRPLWHCMPRKAA